MENNMTTTEMWNIFKDMLAYAKEEESSRHPVKEPDMYYSEKIDELVKALTIAKLSFPKIVCDRINPYFKSTYASLIAVQNAITEPLAKNGLVILQPTWIEPDLSTDKIIIKTRLAHISGQWVESRARLMLAKNDVQAYGSALSYYKRYQITSLLSLGTDIDDDGEEAMSDIRNDRIAGTKETFQAPKPNTPTLSQNQTEELERILQGEKGVLAQLLNAWNVNGLKDLPADKFEYLKGRIRINVEAARKKRNEKHTSGEEE